MVTIGLMIILLVFLAFMCIANIKYVPQKTDFFDIKDTVALRGLFCLIIVLVHVPLAYQNKIQDMIGSFAYIGVTYFFMVSAYGLKCGYNKKGDYLKWFWLNRGFRLIIPVLIVNFYTCFVSLLFEKQRLNIWTLLYVDEWVKVLLLFYLVFWLVYCIPVKKKCTSWGWRDYTICIIVLISSLIDRLTEIKITSIWPVECIGFIWGIVLYNSAGLLQRFVNRRWFVNVSILSIASLFTGVVYLKCKYIPFGGDYLLRIALGVIILLFLMCLLVRISIFNRISLFLGRISYEIYLVHGFVFDELEIISAGQLDSAVYIWLSIIITIIISFFVHVLSEWVYKLGKFVWDSWHERYVNGIHDGLKKE